MGRRATFYITRITAIANNLQADGVDRETINTLLSTTHDGIAGIGKDTSQLSDIWANHFKATVYRLKGERLLARYPNVYQTHDLDQRIEMTTIPELAELSHYMLMQNVSRAGSAAICGKFTSCFSFKTANESVVDALDHVIATRRGPQAQVIQREAAQRR